MALFLRPAFSPLPRPISKPARMAMKSFSPSISEKRKLPILLFDVMDTLVRDPFYQDVPAFFGMPMKELLETKHPTAWIEFEKGLINELPEEISFDPYATFLNIIYRWESSDERIDVINTQCSFRVICIRRISIYSAKRIIFRSKCISVLTNMELAKKFFKDGRPFDLEGLKECMRSGYSFIDGIEALLYNLKQNNYEMHAFTNYPTWYMLIEDKLKISTYLSWTFCSCKTGKRKPAAEAYLEVLQHLGVEPASCVFIDDRMANVEAAVNAGMVGLHFKNAASLQQDLSLLGIETGSSRHDSPRNCNSTSLAEENSL